MLGYCSLNVSASDFGCSPEGPVSYGVVVSTVTGLVVTSINFDKGILIPAVLKSRSDVNNAGLVPSSKNKIVGCICPSLAAVTVLMSVLAVLDFCLLKSGLIKKPCLK